MIGWYQLNLTDAVVVDKITDTHVVSRYAKVGCNKRPTGKSKIRYERKTLRKYFMKDGFKYFLDQMLKGD